MSDGNGRGRSREYFDESDIFSPINNNIPRRVYDSNIPADKVYVNLDDEYDDDMPGGLDAYNRWLKRKERKKRNKSKFETFWKVWSVLRAFIVPAACVAITVLLLYKVGNKLYNDYFMPVDPNDATPIVVEIPSGSGASTIAKILYEAGGEDAEGLIPHKAVFKVYVDFIGKSSRLQAGTYVLSRNMSIPEIVDVICKGNPPRETISVTIPEGLTVEATANKLVELGVYESPDRFIELCITGEAFIKDHPFINDIPVDESGERKYMLEGFLFPDTYDIYADANEETLIDKMLTRFEQIFGPIYTARANELGLSFYEVTTLASLIEKEAKTFDFARVSAVFSNRTELNMPYASDASLEYVLQTGSLNLTIEQLETPSLYNTHINVGLPLGPVSNPGDAALSAALYPDEQYIADGYLYFCLMDPETGALVFAKTLDEHNRNVAKYSPLW
ncbi:MAG: endolytic transglycosylase MltG [Christensenellaceae bacterium]|nr:endolytic transglycosylase MltG [Christensenellaceae bacterium]